MKNILFKFLSFFFCFLLFSCNPVQKQEKEEDIAKEIEKKIEKIIPGTINLKSVTRTDIEGYYEVNFEGMEPLYASPDGRYLISGDIYEISERGFINVSDSRKEYQRITALDKLEKEEFISFDPPKQIKHSIFVFTDVDCVYCRQFHNQIDEYLDLGIQVNYLAFPRAGLESESFRKITTAWCSANPQYTLTQLKLGKNLEEALCLNNPVKKHFSLGSSLGVKGTPTIITNKGKLIPGYLPPEDLIKELESQS